MIPNREGAPVVVTGLVKRYGAQRAVDEIDLHVRAGEFMTLLGPSGSGKTTTLSLIAGFLAPDAGTIEISGRDVTALPAHKRNLGVVFQNYALFPHMTVEENVAFPLSQRKVDKEARRRKVAQALEAVQLDRFAHRRPAELSGGQQQRVALARAIVFEPEVLLMDEPLGALDRGLRDSMQVEIKRLHQEVGSTVIFVTHDQEEALALSDRIAVFNDGRIEQVGAGDELYERPCSPFIAGFIGESTQLRGTVRRDGEGAYLDGPTRVPVSAATDSAVDSSAVLVLRPEKVTLSSSAPQDGTGIACVPAQVLTEMYLGPVRKYTVALPDGSQGVVRESTHRGGRVAPGESAWLSWRLEDAVLLPAAPCR